MPVQLRCTVATAVLVLAASATAQPASRAILTGYVDRNGRVVEPATWEGGSDPVAGDWVAVTRAGKTGFLNLRTHATTGLKFDGTAADNARVLFADGPEPVRAGRLWGYADDTGALVITPQFAEARPFGADGLAIAIADAGGVRRQGMIDHTGRWVIPVRFELLRRFSGGLAVFARGDRYGAIDRTGREVIAPAFTMLQDFADNGLAGATLDNPFRFDGKARWGYVDRTGRWIISAQFDSVGSFKPGQIDGGLAAPVGLARVGLTSTQVGWIDAQGRLAVRFPAGIIAWGLSPNGLVRFQETATAHYGFTDTSGRIVIPAHFSQVGGFDAAGLASATIGTQAGYIHANGQWAFPPRFTSTGTFDATGQAEAEENGTSELIDRTGRVLATLTHGENFYWRRGPYANFQLYPPRFDYPPQRFGRWTLTRTLYAVPRVPIMGPAPIGEISLSFRTSDGLVRWGLDTQGWVLNATTAVGPAVEPDMTASTALKAVPATPDALLPLWRASVEPGGAGLSIGVTPPDAPARAAQRERLAQVAAARKAHEEELDAAVADLPAALTALRGAITEQFGQLPGAPCMPPQCVY